MLKKYKYIIQCFCALLLCGIISGLFLPIAYADDRNDDNKKEQKVKDDYKDEQDRKKKEDDKDYEKEQKTKEESEKAKPKVIIPITATPINDLIINPSNPYSNLSNPSKDPIRQSLSISLTSLFASFFLISRQPKFVNQFCQMSQKILKLPAVSELYSFFSKLFKVIKKVIKKII